MPPKKQHESSNGTDDKKDAGAHKRKRAPEQDSHGDHPQRSELDRSVYDAIARNLPSFNTPAAPRDDTRHLSQQQTAVPVRAGPPASSQQSLGPQGAKVKWDAANDRKLLLFGLGREILSADYRKIASWFPEQPTRKAIENRVLRLRKESLAALKDTGIYDPDPVTEGESSGGGEKRASKRPRLMPTPTPPVRSVSRLGERRTRWAPELTRNNLDVPFGPPLPWSQKDVEDGEDGEEDGEDEVYNEEDEDDLYG